MVGRVNINTERCKGCGLCVDCCPKQLLAISKQSNTLGHFYVATTNDNCTGCALCALICPDVAIEVFRQVSSDKAQTIA